MSNREEHSPDLHARPMMGTLVTIQVVHANDQDAAAAAVERAFGWFQEIEERCTRFNPQSELMQLTAHTGIAVPASAILFEVVRFALEVAEQTNGAFDPTVGHRMEQRGFNREYRTGQIVSTAIGPGHNVSYRDVLLDAESRTITLCRPLLLDLGAVAKGLAVDAAAHELEPFRDFAIDAGGDLFFGGSNLHGSPWSVGIRHPRRHRELIDSLRVSDIAVCTSGDYESRVADDGGHHILDPRTGMSPHSLASATVLASSAMLADALATAALVLGAEDGIQLLHRAGVEGLLVTPDLDRFETEGLSHVAA